MQDVAIWIGIVVGIITATGVIFGGLFVGARLLWYGATIVSESKQGNVQIGEIKDSLHCIQDDLHTHSRTLEEIRGKVDEHGRKLEEHGQSIGFLKAVKQAEGV